MTEDGRRKRAHARRNVVWLMLLILLVIAIALVVNRSRAERRRRAEEARLAAMETEALTTAEPETAPETEPETEAPYVSPIDFESLQEQNPDTIGWIRIPDTKIDYPIVHSADNEDYLHKDFEGRDSVYGTIFLDCDSQADFGGWNNVLYGHHMKDGSMFKDVVKYKEQEYFKKHQYFEIYTPERTVHLKAVACYYTGAGGIVRKTRFDSRMSFESWMKERLSPCSYAEVPDWQVDSMFVLVTCSYELDNARTVLFAVEVPELLRGQVGDDIR